MTSTLKARVEAGAKYLDKHNPGWAKKVNLNTLDLTDAGYCILGQVRRGGYDGAAQSISLGDMDKRIELGFTDGKGFSMGDDCVAERLWVREIKKRIKAR